MLGFQEEDIFTHLKKPTKVELEEQFKKHNIDINAKLRAQKQNDAKNSRYKIVNCFRSQNSLLNDNLKESDGDKVTVYDIETEICEEAQSNHEEIVTGNEPKYVYDLYYTTSDDLGDASLEEYVRLFPFIHCYSWVYL